MLDFTYMYIRFLKLANTLSGKDVIALEDKSLRNTSLPLLNSIQKKNNESFPFIF